MNKKIITLFLIFVGCLGFALASGLYFLSSKIRDIQGPLIRYLQSQIDGEIQIGEAKAVLIPAGIDLFNVKLFAPGETEPSATIRSAQLRFNLIPLIQKKIETSLHISEPDIQLRRGTDGKTNMEKIFAPLVRGESKQEGSALEGLWWKRLAINRLRIDKANFTSTRAGSPEKTELKGVSIEADHIRFESGGPPAKLAIRYEMPRISREPMELKTSLRFDEARQSLDAKDGVFRWGPHEMSFTGEAGLPSSERKEVALDFRFDSKPIDLKMLGKLLVDPLPASGLLSLKGSVSGTAFSPALHLVLDSPALQLSGKNLSQLHAELSKQGKPVEIKNASFGIYGGAVGVSGQAIPGDPIAANFNVVLKGLSLAAMSGSEGHPARLSGNLQLVGKNIQNPMGFSGGGKLSAGPFPLPVVNLQNKVRVADVLAAGTGLGNLVNLGMLASSANVIGTQIDQIHATVRIAGGNITLAPFSMGNGHFNASGSGTVYQQKSVNASGTFVLNGGVTARLLPDPRFRSAMTNGKGVLAVPFTASGPLADPNVVVDSGYLKGLAGKATALGLTNILAGGVRPNEMLNSALKGTPLGDPKNPLGQILGTAPPPVKKTPSSQKSTPSNRTKTGSSKSVTGNKLVDQMLFGQ